MSDKSALAGGLLQIFFGIFGIGRFYIGSPAIGLIQLCLMIISFPLMIVFHGGSPFVLRGLLGPHRWDSDASGVVKDGKGRKLRPAGN